MTSPHGTILLADDEEKILKRLGRALRDEGYDNLLLASRSQLDLRDQAAVDDWFRAARPDYVFLAAGTVGGILANSTRPAEFIYDNLMIHATVVHAAHRCDCRKLLYLGSSCIYPRDCPQPIREAYLLTGPLEPSGPVCISVCLGVYDFDLDRDVDLGDLAVLQIDFGQ